MSKVLIKNNINLIINLYLNSEFKKYYNQKVQNFCIIYAFDMIKEILNNFNKKLQKTIIIIRK